MLSCVCVRFWYEICDILVPIHRSVKFTKCEICGSSKRAHCSSYGDDQIFKSRSRYGIAVEYPSH